VRCGRRERDYVAGLLIDSERRVSYAEAGPTSGLYDPGCIGFFSIAEDENHVMTKMHEHFSHWKGYLSDFTK
jgi:hypothetical protein